MKKIHRLEISWSLSRGRDTYGYNICRLDDDISKKRYRTLGGGYDMVGTVFGQWLQDNYPEKLQALREGRTPEDCNYSVPGYTRYPEFYGLVFTPDGKPRVDGACGIESMIRLAEGCGFEVERSWNRRGQTRAFHVFSKE